MIIGSHNSWSYLKPLHWWMYPFRFMAKCQSKSIKEQYNAGVRCFDLRIKFKEGNLYLAHGFMIYKYNYVDLSLDLQWLNDRPDEVCIRILHEVRNESEYTNEAVFGFRSVCNQLPSLFPNLKFWCGRNLYNWEEDYEFSFKPSCEEKYSSVCKPKWLDDWWPWLFAKLNNKKIVKQGTDKDILLIDYIQYA